MVLLGDPLSIAVKGPSGGDPLPVVARRAHPLHGRRCSSESLAPTTKVMTSLWTAAPALNSVSDQGVVAGGQGHHPALDLQLTDGKTGLSPQTIHHVHTCLHKACEDAVRWGQLSRNPLDAADPPRAKGDGSREMHTWTKEQLKAFLDAVHDDRLSPLWHTIAMTGMRRGEALGLRWSDVDLEAGRLSVRRALIPINRDVVVSEPKTAKGRRVVALDPGTIEVLKGQAARQLEEHSEWDEGWTKSGLVFTSENGAALDPESIRRFWRPAVKKTMRGDAEMASPLISRHPREPKCRSYSETSSAH